MTETPAGINVKSLDEQITAVQRLLDEAMRRIEELERRVGKIEGAGKDADFNSTFEKGLE